MATVNNSNSENYFFFLDGANTPVSVGDPNSRFDRGWIVVADDVASAYLDADITGVAWTIDAAGNTPA